MWIAFAAAVKLFLTAGVLLVASRHQLAFAAFFLALALLYFSGSFREQARDLEERRTNLWKKKHRTADNLRPFIHELCKRIMAKEGQKTLIEPLLALGPGPYVDKDIDGIMGCEIERYSQSYFYLISFNLLWPNVFTRTYQWSERLWEMVDQRAPKMPENWEPEGHVNPS